MVPPLLDANAIVGIRLRCVALPNLSRNGLLLNDGGGLRTESGVTRKRKRPTEVSRFFTQRLSSDTPN
jgi:hypothetical protein